MLFEKASWLICRTQKRSREISDGWGRFFRFLATDAAILVRRAFGVRDIEFADSDWVSDL